MIYLFSLADHPLLLTLLIVLAVIVVYIVCSYVKSPPDTAYIITGPRTQRVLIGKAGFRFPFFERLDRVPLNLMQVDIKTSNPVPTSEFININVDGVANIKISKAPEQLAKASQIFLQERMDGIIKIAREVLEGNMREIVGQMRLTELVHNRDAFAEKVRDSAMADMEKMGLEIINLTIQNFSDNDNVIVNLGIDNISQIQKTASIAKANSERDVAIAKSLASEEANRSRIEASNKIIEQNTSYQLKESELKIKSDTAKADADAAYSIQQQMKKQTINIAEINAEIARREREVELGNRQVELRERQLDAEVKKKADAEKYAQEQVATADLFKRQRAAEAYKFELLQEAEVKKIQAEAEKYAVQQQAEARKLQAEAEKFAQEQIALGVKAIGEAEAEAIEKKALAMKKMEDAAVLELILKSDVLPKIVRASAEPIGEAFAKVGNITMYGEGNSAKLTEDITKTQTQLFAGIKDATGLDMKTVIAGIAGMLGGKLLADKSTDKE